MGLYANSAEDSDMTRLLRIDASARFEGSFTRRMADHFVERWLASWPGGEVVVRDLARAGVPHMREETLAGFRDPERRSEGLAVSDELIEELLGADQVLIASPLYNFGPPSALKAWVDHVARSGRTFDVGPEGYVGRLQGRDAVVLTACGALEGMTGRDAQVPWLRTVLEFLGFGRVEFVNLAGASVPGDGLERRMRGALRRIDELVDSLGGERVDPEWVGEYSAVDRREIDELRHAQAMCIEEGDADGYAELCTEDVTLLLQGRDLVQGREAFRACERELLERTGFARIRQVPVRIERCGDSVIEVGRQEVQMGSDRGSDAKHYRPERKYTHVLRKTERGWRFASLMSNSNS